jgi:uncharacterized membrane protein (UPF0127 family)
VLVGLGAGLAIDELAAGYPDRATLTFVDENGSELGTADVRVADSYREKFVGLSTTDTLGPDEGMLFVHGDEGPHTYVMRGMSFPIDIVYVAGDGEVSEIYHAEVEERPLTRYRGNGTRVIELPYDWTVRHDVSVGDRVEIDWDR